MIGLMSSEPHITNNTFQITSRYYLYIIRIHWEVCQKFLLLSYVDTYIFTGSLLMPKVISLCASYRWHISMSVVHDAGAFWSMTLLASMFHNNILLIVICM